MKHIKYIGYLALATALVWAAGCATQTAKPASQTAARHEEPAAPPSAANADSKITLPPGVAQPPAPFEGGDWQAMFDGRTLTGWGEIPFAGHGEVHCQDGVIV